MDAQSLSKTYTVRALTQADADHILTLCAGNPQYYRYHPPFVTKDAVLEYLRMLPPGMRPADKLFAGFYRGETLIAVMDLIFGYPAPDVAYFGFFMMDIARQGKGEGSAIVNECAAALAARGYKKIRLAIDLGNPQSEAFWTKNRFVKTGETFPIEGTTLLPMERKL